MGKVKYLREIKDFFRKTPVVSSRDIRMHVRSSYRHLLVSNLIKRGKVKRVVKGFYTIHEDPTVSVFCFRPAYIGLQEALSMHNLWEQEATLVIVTAKKVKKNSIEVFGNNVILHRIKPKYVFGFDMVKYGDFYVPVSDIEKTFIDLVYFNEIPDKKLIKEIKRRINFKKLKGYLRAYPKNTRKRILAFLK